MRYHPRMVLELNHVCLRVERAYVPMHRLEVEHWRQCQDEHVAVDAHPMDLTLVEPAEPDGQMGELESEIMRNCLVMDEHDLPLSDEWLVATRLPKFWQVLQ